MGELDKLKGIKIEESEVKEVVKGEEDSDSETEWKKSKPLAEKLKTVISPPKVIAPVVASEVVQKPVKVEPVAPPVLRSLRAEVEKNAVNEAEVSDLVKQERMQVKKEVEELKKKVAEVKKRRSESKEMVEKKKKRKESGEEESMDEVEKLRLQALKTLRSRTESGRSRSPSQNKKAATQEESPSDSPSLKKKLSKVSKELDEERKRVENQVKESLLKLNKD